MLSSFADLALSRRYSEIGVDSIVRAAKVARSTFYYHFSGKDDLLLENLEPLIEALAAAPFADAPAPELIQWIEHISQHRAQAGRVLKGRTGTMLHNRLAEALRSKLRDNQADSESRLTAMSAEQIAGSSMALLQAWTSNHLGANPAMIAGAISEFSRTAICKSKP